VVISVEKELRWVVEDMVEKQEKIIMVSDKEDKWGAMCGSDMALAITGDIINETAALHLPTIALNF
jgi:lipid A disaccharide synthetase